MKRGLLHGQQPLVNCQLSNSVHFTLNRNTRSLRGTAIFFV